MTHSAPSPLKLDRKAWRTLAGAFVTFGGVGLVFLFGGKLLGFDGAAEVKAWLGEAAGSPFAFPATVAVFAGLAFLGVPQVALIAAAVLALGPWKGMAYSWVGTLISALIGYGLGKRFGARLLRDWAGPRTARIVELISRNGFLASLLIRLAPTAPFIFVNMAAGVADVSLTDFAAGTAIGIAPKIVLTALAGHSLMAPGAHSWWVVGFAAAVWIGLSVLGLAWLKRRDGGDRV